MLLAVRDDGRLVLSSYVPDQVREDVLLARLAARVSPKVLRLPARTDAVRRQLEQFLAGRRRGFDVEVDLALAKDFQRDVLTRLAASVPYGERTTYGRLATDLGRPTASRAVGAALGANPLCVVLPCHRVVAGSGALTGYAGGLDAKRYLLNLESTPTRGDHATQA
jgi:methylated-DNA-[protein]-cysteine S-methyltransferase